MREENDIMRFDTFGDISNKTIMLLPGTCSTWQTNFKNLVPALSKDYHVICVNYDGFDGQDTVFVSMLDVTEKIENYVREHYAGKLDMVMGASMGGSFVGLLVQRKRVHIGHAVLGSSDLDQCGSVLAKAEAALVTKIFFKMMRKPERMRLFEGLAKLKMGMEFTDAFREYMRDFMNDMSFVSEENLFRQFYSDLVTPLQDGIDVPGTAVHILWTNKMGKKYLKRYHRHFKNPDIREFEASHGDWVFMDGSSQRKILEGCFDTISK